MLVFEILETQYSEGDAAKSKDIAANYIAQGCVGIFGCNEGCTVGIGNAIREAGTDVMGIGFDKSDTILELVKEGSLVCTITQNPDLMGYEGIKTAVKALKGEEVGESYVDTGVSIVDAEAFKIKMRITLDNGCIQVAVDTYGGELQSLKRHDAVTEYLWQGNPATYRRKAINIFPYVARLTNGTYMLDGKVYKMQAHGFIADMEMRCEKERGQPGSLSVRIRRGHYGNISPPFPLSAEVCIKREYGGYYIHHSEPGQQDHVFRSGRASGLQGTSGRRNCI